MTQLAAESTNFIEKVELYVTQTITTEFSDKLVYHDIEHVHTVIQGIKEIAKAEKLNEEEQEVAIIAGWLSTIGFKNLETWGEIKEPMELFSRCYSCSLGLAMAFLKSINYPPEKIEIVSQLMADAAPHIVPQTKVGKVIADALGIELATKKGKKRLELRYQELLLTDSLKVGRSGFYDALLDYLYEHKYYTKYGIKELDPKKDELIKRVEKDKKELEKNESHAIKKELKISDKELKKLKKTINSVKGRDERGIQTMFRTTSRNHYTLTQMVDRKANIMISVNAIILSLIISRVIGQIETFCIHNAPILIVLFASVASIVFAIIAITPGKSHGEFTEQEIRNKQGNLLYFGNYYNMTFRDYNWGMLQMLNDSDYLYTSLIRDQYYVGQILSKKYKNIRISLAVFGFGLVVGVVMFILVAMMPDFHLTSQSH